MSQFRAVAEGIVKLLHPFAEVVVHDISGGKIVAIYNPFSKRVVGDPSYLDELDLDGKVIGPYEKLNYNGRKLKSISIQLTEKKENFLLCVNLDVSVFDKYKGLLDLFLQTEKPGKKEEQQLFADDLHERINTFIQGYCRRNHLHIEMLSKEERNKLLTYLKQSGVLKQKHAAAYIARILGISRATVYNSLK